jgi:hypothetical protein
MQSTAQLQFTRSSSARRRDPRSWTQHQRTFAVKELPKSRSAKIIGYHQYNEKNTSEPSSGDTTGFVQEERGGWHPSRAWAAGERNRRRDFGTSSLHARTTRINRTAEALGPRKSINLLHVDRLIQFLSMFPGFYDAISAPNQPTRQKRDHSECQIEHSLEIWILDRNRLISQTNGELAVSLEG